MAEVTRNETTSVIYVVENRWKKDDGWGEWLFWDSYADQGEAEEVAADFNGDDISVARVVKETVVRRNTVTREVLT